MLNFAEISTLKEIFGIATDGEYRQFFWKNNNGYYLLLLLMLFFLCCAEHEAAMVKYSRLPKKKENEKVQWMQSAFSASLMAALFLIDLKLWIKGLTVQYCYR